MNNSANQTKAEAVREIDLGKKTELLDYNIFLPDENVSKILSVSASLVIDKYEALVGEVSFSGEVCINIVYSLEDGSLSNYKVCENFSGKFENFAFDPNSLVKILPNIIDITIEKGNGNSLKIKLTIENNFSLLKNQEILIYKNQDENTFVKENEITLIRQKERNNHTFNQQTTFETKLLASKVLSTNVDINVNKVEVLDGIILIEGETITKILYCINDDPTTIISALNKDVFREEIENNNAVRGDKIQIDIISMNKNIEESFNEEGKTIDLTLPIKVSYDLFESISNTITTDIYSSKNDLKLTSEALISLEDINIESYDNKIDTNITLDDANLRIEKIIATDNEYITIKNQSYENGIIKFESLIHLNILYKNEEENSINSISLEIPYNFSENLELDSNQQIKVNCKIIDLDATVKRGKDIYVDGKLRTEISVIKEIENVIVTEVEKGESYQDRDSAIEIIFANEGSTFWDLAKELKISQDILKKQNPDIIEPFVKDEKITFYDQHIIEIE